MLITGRGFGKSFAAASIAEHEFVFKEASECIISASTDFFASQLWSKIEPSVNLKLEKKLVIETYPMLEIVFDDIDRQMFSKSAVVTKYIDSIDKCLQKRAETDTIQQY